MGSHSVPPVNAEDTALVSLQEPLLADDTSLKTDLTKLKYAAVRKLHSFILGRVI